MRPPGRRQETTTERFVSPYELIEEEQASLKEAKKAKDTRESPGVPPALHRETLNKSPHHWWRLHLQGRSLITAEEKEDAKTGTAASPTTENEQGLNTGSLAGNPYGSATAAALEQRGDTPTTLRRPTNPVHKVAVNKVERREDRKWGQQGDTNSDRQGDKQGTRQKPPQEQRGPSVSPRDLPQQQDHQHQPQRQRQSKVLEDAQQQHHHQKCLVGFGVSSSSKTSNTRSISQPRSLRGLMPRLSPPRRLSSVPLSLGCRLGALQKALEGPPPLKVEATKQSSTVRTSASGSVHHSDPPQRPPTISPGSSTSARGSSKMVLSLLAVGGALSITLSCVAAVGALSTAVRIAEAPIVFLEKKPETPQAFKFQGMAPERPFLRPLEGSSGVPFKVPASEEWMEDKAMHAGPLGELAEGQQQRQQLPRSSSTHALHGGRGSSLEPGLERHEAFIVSSAGSRAVDIGRLRDVPLQELGLSSALLLRPRTDEEHLFRVKDAARNLQTGETLLYLSRGQILLLKQEIGLLLSPEGFVLAAWELPQPFTEGHSRALSLQQLQHRYETEATAAASASSFVSSGSSGDSLKETAEVLGQAEGMMSPSFPNTHRPTPPPPSSPLEFALLDLGEPLLSGFPEESPTKPVHKGQPAVLGPPQATERSGPSQGTGATPFFVAGGPPVMRPEGFQNAES